MLASTRVEKQKDIGTSSRRVANQGKATVLALGKAFPSNVVSQENLVEEYLREIKCDDLSIKDKLQHLCNFIISLYFLSLSPLVQR